MTRMDFEWKLAVALLAAIAMMLLLIPFTLAGTDQYYMGNTDARNATITFNSSGSFYTASTGTGNDINFTGWVNGSTFIWVRDNVWQSNTSIGAGTTVFDFTPGAACTNWAAYWDNTSRILIFRSSSAMPGPTSFLSLSGFSAFYISVYGALAYAFIMLLPITVWLKTKSVSATALMLLFLSVGGIVLVAELRPFAILPIGLAIGVLLYKIFWRND